VLHQIVLLWSFWFFTIDLLPDLIIVLWRTNFKSIPLETEQGLQQYYCYSCLYVETKLQRWWLQRRAQSSWLYTSYTILCQLWWSSFWPDASDNHCFWWRVFRSSIFRLVSSDAVLQTHSSRRFKLQIKFFCSLTYSIRIFMNSTLIMILYTWTNVYHIQLIIFNTLLSSKLKRWFWETPFVPTISPFLLMTNTSIKIINCC